MNDQATPEMNEDPVGDLRVAGLERPPEAPPSGPAVWIRENLLSGATPIARVFNGVLSVAFFLLAIGLMRFVTGFMFSPERRWGAVTANMKFMMVQAFPQENMGRIWLSVIIFFVLTAMSLAAWGEGGKVSVEKTAKAVRAVGIFLLVLVIIHPANPPSSARIYLGVLAIVLAGGAHVALQRYGARAKEVEFPFLSILAIGMVAIAVVIRFLKLPFPTGPFDEAPASIASTTTNAWAVVFMVTIASYFVGRWLVGLAGERMRKWLVIAWVASYPIIIMIIQRNPILDWADMLGFGDTPFLRSDLGAFLLFGGVGAALLWWMALPSTVARGRIYVVATAAVVLAGTWMQSEGSTILKVLVTIVALGVLALGGFVIDDPGEQVRIVGSLILIAALVAWLVPMPFLYRILLLVFALMAVSAPAFGGSESGRRRVATIWVVTALLVVAFMRLGVAESSLQFQGTTFLGGFNITILLAITGVALSFPLGVVLALARTSTMPIFRLLATGYIELVRSVPLITWLFFGSVMLALFLPEGVEFDEVVRVVAAVAIFSAAYVAENVRGGLQSVAKGQYEAARAMGLTTVQSMSFIILPQAIRAVIPALVGSIIVSFKDTSLVAIIGMADILWIARTAIPGQTQPFNFIGTQPQMMFFIALFYWVFTFTFSRLSLRYEKRLGLGSR